MHFWTPLKFRFHFNYCQEIFSREFFGVSFTRLVIITNEQDVDVPSDAGSILQHLLHATQQHAEDGLLDVLVAVDAGGQGTSQLIKDVLKAHSKKGGTERYFSAGEKKRKKKRETAST